MHQGTGHNMIWYRGPGATVANLLATQSMGPRTAAMLATSGVLERHPGLHVVFVEYNAGWIAWMMETIDYYNVAFEDLTTATRVRPAGPLDRPPRPVITPQLEERRASTSADRSTPRFRTTRWHQQHQPDRGRRMLWGSDYPHEEGTYPHSRQTVDRLGAGVEPEEAEKIFRDTAARVFRFDPEVLATPV